MNIDVEKLIEFVNHYKEDAKAALNPIDGEADYLFGKIDACKDIQQFVDSLQQEMWKPSEEQMEALSDATVEVGSFKIADILDSLYNDLQKLL